MKTLDPKIFSSMQIQEYLQVAIAPRPIALASTTDGKGNDNLSPFSFFNIFSSNPPILVFSPLRRGRNNTTKHTLNNVLDIKEVVINIVNFDIVQQASLASTEYEEDVDEFIKAGFTKLPSEVVKPFRVAESPIQIECKVNEIIALGNEAGAGNLVICEVLRIHISESILDTDERIDPYKIDLVARMGGNWYTRANRGIFEVEKPLVTLAVGVDAVPKHVVASGYFSGNELGMLGNVAILPAIEEVMAFAEENREIKQWQREKNVEAIYAFVRENIKKGRIDQAWKALLLDFG